MSLMRLHSGHLDRMPFFCLFCAFVMFVLDGVSFVIVALRPSHLLVRIDGSL